MNVFIGWSNCREIAVRLNDFLRKFFQGHIHFDFSEEIPQGSVWHSQLTQILRSADFGILCITPKSRVSWLCYEAGALSQRVRTEGLILPLLFGVDTAAFRRSFGPLSHYQHSAFNRQNMIRLLTGLNDASRNIQEDEEAKGIDIITRKYLEDHELETRFNQYYPDFETDIRRLMMADELENHLAELEREGTLPPTVGMSAQVLHQRGETLLNSLRSGTPDERGQALDAFGKHLEYITNRLDEAGIYPPTELKNVQTDAVQLADVI